MSPAKILELTFKPLATTVLIAITIVAAYSQKINSVKQLEFKYGYHFPLGDMQDRFGTNSDFGLGITVARFPTNIFAGVDGIFIFSNNVKEDVLAGLRSFDGSIIGIDGSRGDINLKERGFYLGLNAGKIFKTNSIENNLTGFRVQIGGGLLQHKIRVQDNLNSIVGLEKSKLSGYDRLTNGPAGHLAFGYQHQGSKNNFQFNIMADLYGGSTKSRRDFDNATGGYLDKQRFDILAGFSIGYIVSISRGSIPENIYY